MDIDLLTEIKNLHTCMIKKIFGMKKEHNCKHPRPLQIAILEYLRLNSDKDIHQKDLEEKFKISKAAISDVLNTMEKKDMISRITSEVDARKKKIVLTDNSKEIQQELLENQNKANKEMLEGISEEEIKNFLKTIEKIKANLRKEG